MGSCCELSDQLQAFWMDKKKNVRNSINFYALTDVHSTTDRVTVTSTVGINWRSSLYTDYMILRIMDWLYYR